MKSSCLEFIASQFSFVLNAFVLLSGLSGEVCGRLFLLACRLAKWVSRSAIASIEKIKCFAFIVGDFVFAFIC